MSSQKSLLNIMQHKYSGGSFRFRRVLQCKWWEHVVMSLSVAISLPPQKPPIDSTVSMQVTLLVVPKKPQCEIRNASSAIYDIWKISPQFLSLFEFNFMFVFYFHFFCARKIASVHKTMWYHYIYFHFF